MHNFESNARRGVVQAQLCMRKSQLTTAPNKQFFADVLRERFDVDVNALKRECMSPESQ